MPVWIAAYGIIFPLRAPCTESGKGAHSEDTPRQPVNPYGVSKLFFEQALDAYDRAYGLRFTSLRYFNARAPMRAGRLASCTNRKSHLIPSAFLAASGARAELEVFARITLPGWHLRPRLHSRERSCGRARVSAGAFVGGRRFHCGESRHRKGHSVKEVLNKVEQVTGHKFPCVLLRAGGRPSRPGSRSQVAEEVLRWKATQSLDDIVTTAWRWMKGACAEVDVPASIRLLDSLTKKGEGLCQQNSSDGGSWTRRCTFLLAGALAQMPIRTA